MVRSSEAGRVDWHLARFERPRALVSCTLYAWGGKELTYLRR